MGQIMEIAPGVAHWSEQHPRIGQPVHSYWVPDSAALIDPMVPAAGPEAFEASPPQRILLTNRHHYRGSGPIRERYGCTVHCHRAGLHEFEGGPEVAGFEWGTELGPGITAHEVGVLCPEETALLVERGPGFLALADSVIRIDGDLDFVPDFLLGDDPEAIKEGLRESLGRMLELPFDGLLLAHGSPQSSGGKQALAEFVRAGG